MVWQTLQLIGTVCSSRLLHRIILLCHQTTTAIRGHLGLITTKLNRQPQVGAPFQLISLNAYPFDFSRFFCHSTSSLLLRLSIGNLIAQLSLLQVQKARHSSSIHWPNVLKGHHQMGLIIITNRYCLISCNCLHQFLLLANFSV